MECFVLLDNCLLSNNYLKTQKTRFAVSVVEILYENIPPTKMLSGLKEGKKPVPLFFAFTGSTSLACLKLTTLPRRIIVNRLKSVPY